MKNRGLNNLNASKEVGWEVGSQISDSHSRFIDKSSWNWNITD